ncbi:molecular chaperone [Achromobacter sp. NPDC058515]|uniref:fimbrial biogenesis chaperone n=1 Tax=Achromobacter sp. NPDC058515 TaxID=3346533 RepID=UPI00365D1257
MNILFQRLLPAIAAMGVLSGAVAEAAVQLSTTRVIVNEKDRNVSVSAKNHGADPFVVQAWIDGDSEEMETPFFVTPPLSRFDGKAERSLNITRVSAGMPGDRESYYWLNVLEIPQKKAAHTDNSLTLATRTRIKLFYRPAAIQQLPRGPSLAQWSWAGDGKQCWLAIKNASAFTVNFAAIEIMGEAAGFARTVVAKPLATTQVPLGKCPSGVIKATAHVVNDFGVVETWPEVAVQPETGSPERRQQ